MRENQFFGGKVLCRGVRTPPPSSHIADEHTTDALYNHFSKFLTTLQHQFFRQKSTVMNMLSFLQKVNKALDEDSSSENVAFYADFFKPFVKVPQFELLRKAAEIGVGGCILAVLVDYMTKWQQFVRVENVCLQMKDVGSGVPQGSLLVIFLF